MIKGNSHLRYSEALYRAALSLQVESQVKDDLMQLQEVFRDKKFRHLLAKIAFMNKSQLGIILEKVFAGRIQGISLNLLKKLGENRKLTLIQLIADRYISRYYREKGISEITLISARKLSNEEENGLVSTLRQKLENELSVTFKTDITLIGGIQIHERGFVTDLSVKNQLNFMRNALLNN